MIREDDRATALRAQMTVSQMSIQNTTPSLQRWQHWLSEQALLGTHAARIASGASFFFAPVSDRLQLVRYIHTRRGTGLRRRMRNRLEYHHGEVESLPDGRGRQDHVPQRRVRQPGNLDDADDLAGLRPEGREPEDTVVRADQRLQ